jgi:hypothetical protein
MPFSVMGEAMAEKNNFKVGECYSRKEIAAKLGGGIQNYLPHKDGHVVCGCFRKDLNPGAPWEVLPANTDDKRRWAEQFRSQPEAVPIFLKKGSNEWEYQGRWRCVSVIKDAAIIAQKRRESGRTSLSMVLKLENVSE